MFRRKVDYIKIIADECLFDEETLDKMLAAKIEPHEIEYTVSFVSGEAYSLSPTPYEIAKTEVMTLDKEIHKLDVDTTFEQFSAVFLSIRKEAEIWEDANFDRVVKLDEDARRESMSE